MTKLYSVRACVVITLAALALGAIGGCAPAPTPTPTAAPLAPTLAPSPTRVPATATAAPTSPPVPSPTVERKVSYVRGSSQKICQITGDLDREKNQPTLNQTLTRFGVAGTDLGFSFEHDGKIFFLFGDTLGRGKFPASDSIAFSSDTNPEDCLALEFVVGPDKNFLSPTLPGISLGGFEVPSGGLSANGKMYVFLTTEHTEQKTMGRALLARSADNARSFQFVADISRDKFINLTPVVINADLPGVPQNQGQGVLLWGSGDYRKSDPYLAYAPLNQFEDRKEWRFFTGMQAGSPRWSADESAAVSLFRQPCIGELSVTWNQFLRKWLMLYNCNQPRGINFRVADQPWGPWSATQTLFDPQDDNGFCHFIHLSWEIRKCDEIGDRGQENENGSPYAPHVISRFTTGNANQTTLYYVMSTWKPYQVVLMKSILRLE